MAKKRVAIALSGGVDSSVAASLLQDEGYEVIGITMRLWTEETERQRNSGQALQNIRDAEQTYLTMGIPFHIIDLENEFKHHVVDYFCTEYNRGRTPNPCVVCNRDMKFGLLLDYAISLGADYLATGHYVSVEHFDNVYHLLKGSDREKDQSYMLYTLRQDQLARLLFPLCKHHKTEVRKLAQKKGLPTAYKASSQDICFITRDYGSFLSRYHPTTPGDIVDRQGKVMGKHRGTAFYTVGQRHGLGIATTMPIYITRIESETNRIVVAGEEEIFRSTLVASELNWIEGKPPTERMAVSARIRYRSPEVAATIYPQANSVEVMFQRPQRAVAPGQSVVFYQGNEVIGGGIIQA
jgi:tRNA-specific 2-thiouridylase